MLYSSPLKPEMEFSCLIRSCAITKSASRGRALHAKIIVSGSHPNVYTNNHLIAMYCKSNRIQDARKLFDTMPERNNTSWTTLISSYSQMGLPEEALDCFRSMVCDGFVPNHYTFVGAISACASLGDATTGAAIHGRIYRTEQELNSFLTNSLVNFYGKCGLLNKARRVFDEIPEPNFVTWSSILSSYCQSGDYEEGLKIFSRSIKSGVKVNEFSCSSVLAACASLENLNFGMLIHCSAIKNGITVDQFVITGLVNVYSKCNKLDLARQAFLEVDRPQFPACTALIGGFVQQGKNKEAIDMFCKLYSSGLKPSERTFASVLGAFSNASEIEGGKQIHCLIMKLGFCSFTFVTNAILHFYSKIGFLDETLIIFHDTKNKHDIITWNALISGFLNSGDHNKAIEILRSMLNLGFDPNLHTYSIILSVCGDLPAIEWGKQTHCSILKPGFDSNVVVGTTLIDMYAKCGRLNDARNVFDSLPIKNTVSWNTILVGYSQHGFGEKALEIYDLMRKKGIKPNEITFIGVLSACGHVGLLQEGLNHFESMTRDYKLRPRTDHLACMVSLFARKGQTREAYDFITKFNIEPDKVVWRCLLSSCKTHKDFVLGKFAAEKILSIDPDDASAHIMLSNIYSESKMWGETAKIRKLMKEKALKKDTGYSWTELKNKVYSFSSGHDLNSRSICAYEVLRGLTAQLFDLGYVPETVFLSDYYKKCA